MAKTLRLNVELTVVESCTADHGGECAGGEHQGYMVGTGSGYQGIPDAELPEALAALTAEVVATALGRIAKEDPSLAKILRERMELAELRSETDPTAPSIAETYQAFGETPEHG